MLMEEHYLDNAATTKTCPEARDAAIQVMENIYGNPSSTHTKGREAKKALDEYRNTLATALGAKSEEIVFTSCGSESDNWAIIQGAFSMQRFGKHIISSTVEHDAVRKSLDFLEKEGFEITRLQPDSDGSVSVSSVLSALRPDTILVSLMMVNNETGGVTDIAGIAKEMKISGTHALLHTDAVQGFLKVPFAAKTLGADLISISGHKIHAVKGIGALYIRNGKKISPFIVGGSQEFGLRAGTEAMPQIAAFAAASKIDPQIEKMAALKKGLIEKLSSSLTRFSYIPSAAPHILNISMPGWRSEVLMNFLEARKIFVSKSSACKQGKRSHVLEALQLPGDVIDGSLRIGLSRFTTEEDIDALVTSLIDAQKLQHR